MIKNNRNRQSRVRRQVSDFDGLHNKLALITVRQLLFRKGAAPLGSERQT